MTYSKVEMPDHEDWPKYNVKQRRSIILKLVLKLGHPMSVNKTALARKFDVSNAMIWKDFNMIKKAFVKDLGNDALFITKSVFQKVAKDLLEGSNHDKFNAVKVIDMWNNYLFNIGVVEKAPEKREFSGDLSLSLSVVERDDLLRDITAVDVEVIESEVKDDGKN